LAAKSSTANLVHPNLTISMEAPTSKIPITIVTFYPLFIGILISFIVFLLVFAIVIFVNIIYRKIQEPKKPELELDQFCKRKELIKSESCQMSFKTARQYSDDSDGSISV